jgi:alginate O-acetyltransferase complex protein AlgI
MLFCSERFILFFVTVFAVYWALPWQRARIYVLLIASFVFYATWNRWLAVLILVSSTLDYFIALRIDACRQDRQRKILLGLSVLFNLGILCYFKYADFFLRSLEDALQVLGMSSSLPVLSVILPVGISFYTFEAISYNVDVYRGKIKAEREWSHFMLFILFFPHLVAGPIVRGSDFLPQIQRKKRLTWPRLNLGIQLFLIGMFKKLALGDRIATLVDVVYADPGSFSAPMLWLAALGFAVQLYCDFSGYSDMALGTAHLLGYRLAPNFNLPFLAANISEFWRRWHMTLSNWIRDYVYIPLGGNRGSFWSMARNLLIAMSLCGLWHGASWCFVLFGLSQGVFLVIYQAARKALKDRPAAAAVFDSRPAIVCGVALTFVLFSLSLVFFRSENLSQSWKMFQGLFAFHGFGQVAHLNYVTIACAFIMVGIGYWMAYQERWRRLLREMPPQLVGVGYSIMSVLALTLAPGALKSFIYFQF